MVEAVVPAADPMVGSGQAAIKSVKILLTIASAMQRLSWLRRKMNAKCHSTDLALPLSVPSWDAAARPLSDSAPS